MAISEEKEALLAQAKALGINASKYWSDTKIKSEIASHQTPQEVSKEVDKQESPTPSLNTTQANTDNRMMRHGKNPPCPECGAHPTICQMRRQGYSKHRCRTCGHRWDIDNRPRKSGYLPGREGNILFMTFDIGGVHR